MSKLVLALIAISLFIGCNPPALKSGPDIREHLAFLEDVSLNLKPTFNKDEHTAYASSLRDRSQALLKRLPVGSREDRLWKSFDSACYDFLLAGESNYDDLNLRKNVGMDTTAFYTKRDKLMTDLKEKAREVHRLLLTPVPE